MSIKEIKEHLKRNVDKLSVAETRMAAKELGMYFEYLKVRKEMPSQGRLSFEDYLRLSDSLQQMDNGKVISASKAISGIKKKYGFSS